MCWALWVLPIFSSRNVDMHRCCLLICHCVAMSINLIDILCAVDVCALHCWSALLIWCDVLSCRSAEAFVWLYLCRAMCYCVSMDVMTLCWCIDVLICWCVDVLSEVLLVCSRWWWRFAEMAISWLSRCCYVSGLWCCVMFNVLRTSTHSTE